MAELSVLMCKKIAQLTKVIYQLNTVNEDHTAELEATRRQHRAEMSEAMRDATSKLKKFEADVKDLKKSANVALQLDKERDMHAKEKARMVASFEQRLAESEASKAKEWTATADRIRNDVTTLKRRVQEAVGVWQESMATADRCKVQWARERENLCTERDQMLAAKSHDYKQMLETHMKIQDDLRAQSVIAEKEAEAKGREAGRQQMETRIGQLRAELRAEKEEALATAKREGRNELESLKADAARSAAEAARRSRAELADIEGTLEAQVTAVKMRLNELTKELDAVTKTRDEAMRDRDAARSVLAARDVEASSLSQDKSALALELDQIHLRHRNELDSAREHYHKDLAATEALAKSELEKCRQQHHDELRALENKLSDVEKMRAESLEALEATKIEYAAFSQRSQRELAERDAELSRLHTDVISAREDAKQSAQGFERRLEAAQAAAARTLQAERAAYEGRLREGAAAHDTKLVEAKHALRAALAERDAAETRWQNDSEAARLALTRAEEAARQQVDEAVAAQQAIAKRAQSAFDAERAQLRAELDSAVKASSANAESAITRAERLESDLKTTQAQLGSAKSEFKRQQAVSESLKGQVDELRQQLEATMVTARRRLEETVKRLEEEWSNRCTDSVSAATEAIRARAMLEKAQDQAAADDLRLKVVGELEERLAQANRLASGLDTELREVRQARDTERAAAQERDSDATQRIAQLTNDLDKTTTALKREQSSASLAATTASAKISELESQVHRMNHQLSSQARDAAGIKAEIESELQASRRDLATTVDDLQGSRRRCAELSDALDTNIHQLHELQRTTAADAQRSEARHADEIEALRRDFDAKRRTLEDIAAKDLASLAEKHCSELKEVHLAHEAHLNDKESDIAVLHAQAVDADLAAEATMSAIRHLLNQEYAAHVTKLHHESANRHDAMLEAFEADRQRRVEQLASLESAYNELHDKYQNRDSRPEDLHQIAQLQNELKERTDHIAALTDNLERVRREVMNREENYNRRFNNNPVVGVMNVLKQPKAPSTQPPHKALANIGRSDTQRSNGPAL